MCLNASEKIRRVQGKVKRVEEKISDLVAKFNKPSEGLLQESFLPSGIYSRELKRIWAKSVPSWMNCKLNCASLSFKPATSSIRSIMSPGMRTRCAMRRVKLFWMSVIVSRGRLR